ncbi:hypothetical protein HZB78_02245 [Candidatus Collierbacteria bacterium]|nr:hypothetical protein [Candidatus Collierbacteria bacterium]
MSDEAPKLEPEEILPAQAKRQAAAETAATIMATLGDQQAEAKGIAAAAAGRVLDTLAPGQANATASSETIQRAAGRIANNQQLPGPTLVQRLINKIRGVK